MIIRSSQHLERHADALPPTLVDLNCHGCDIELDGFTISDRCLMLRRPDQDAG